VVDGHVFWHQTDWNELNLGSGGMCVRLLHWSDSACQWEKLLGGGQNER